MDKLNVYEIEADCEIVESLLGTLLAYLKKAGFNETLHVHEPPRQVEVFEFSRSEKILSVEIDRQSIDACTFRLTSSTIEPKTMVVKALARLCADLVATFIRPIAGRVGRRELERHFSDEIEGLIAR